MSADPETRGTGSLVSDALEHLSRLVRGEVALAKAEAEEKLRSAGLGVGLLIGAVIIALVSLNVLAGALVAALAELGLDPGLAALIVGGALALVAAVLAMRGADALKPENLVPNRTAENLRRDAKTLKEMVTNDSSH